MYTSHSYSSFHSVRSVLLDFCNVEDVRHVFVTNCSRLSVSSSATSFQPGAKSIVFMKCTHASKLSKETMDRDVAYVDCAAKPMEYLQVVTREMLLPLSLNAGERNSGNLAEIMEKLVGTIEVIRGRKEVCSLYCTVTLGAVSCFLHVTCARDARVLL